jgi:N-acetylmuramoyl-L-alanine amidase
MSLQDGRGSCLSQERRNRLRAGWPRERAAHGIDKPRRWGGVFAIACVAAGCASHSTETTTAPPSDKARAEALLDAKNALPPRAEVVALSDAIAIASSREGRNAAGAELAQLGADLRTRIWRVDQAAADAREALELYAAAAGAAAGSEQGCEADRRRAMLAGELARDANMAYRELYLASRRQSVLASVSAGRSPCLLALSRALAQAIAFRPSGDALAALENEGNKAAHAAAQTAGTASGAAGLPAAPVTAASVTPLAPAAASSSPQQLVIAPREDTVAKGPVKLTSVEPYGSDKGGRVVVNLSAPATFQVGTLGADEAKGKDARIFVDIAQATARGIQREIQVGGVVRRVRVGAQPASTRVVLDLTASPYRRVFYLPDPFRIVIDVSTRPPSRADKPNAEGKREVRRVAIDPGHGGHDAGAVGPTGLREKDVTLDIAHRVAPLLAHELKIETLLTRDTDAFVPLDLRTARANAFHADLFVSIHCNASEDGLARGVQTFSLDRVRDPEGFASRVAARENAVRAPGGRPATPAANLQAVEDEMARIASSLDVGELTARSHHMADLLQRSAMASLAPRYPDTRDQGVKTAGFFVLAGADMPAALFETAFISNPDDEARLATADFRQKMADAIVNAVRAYRDGK